MSWLCASHQHILSRCSIYVASPAAAQSQYLMEHEQSVSHLFSVACHLCPIISHRISSHVVALRVAPPQFVALLDLCRITSLLIASHVEAERMSVNPCGGCGVYPCGGNWDERTLAGVAECTLAGATESSECNRSNSCGVVGMKPRVV
jgi:hypothetical protein